MPDMSRSLHSRRDRRMPIRSVLLLLVILPASGCPMSGCDRTFQDDFALTESQVSRVLAGIPGVLESGLGEAEPTRLTSRARGLERGEGCSTECDVGYDGMKGYLYIRVSRSTEDVFDLRVDTDLGEDLVKAIGGLVDEAKAED